MPYRPSFSRPKFNTGSLTPYNANSKILRIIEELFFLFSKRGFLSASDPNKKRSSLLVLTADDYSFSFFVLEIATGSVNSGPFFCNLRNKRIEASVMRVDKAKDESVILRTATYLGKIYSSFFVLRSFRKK